jgi:hypothetical protein
MERTIPAAITARLGDRVVYPVLLYEGTFFSAGAEVLLNLWSGFGDLVYDGKTWIGGGNLLGVTPVEETTEMRAIGFTVSLNGQSSANISTALQSVRQGKPGKLWLALLDQAGAVLDKQILKRGKLDVVVIEDSGADCRISVTYEDVLIDLERPRERKYTHEDQQLDYPGDKGFSAVPMLQDLQIQWGRP